MKKLLENLACLVIVIAIIAGAGWVLSKMSNNDIGVFLFSCWFWFIAFFCKKNNIPEGQGLALVFIPPIILVIVGAYCL